MLHEGWERKRRACRAFEPGGNGRGRGALYRGTVVEPLLNRSNSFFCSGFIRLRLILK